MTLLFGGAAVVHYGLSDFTIIESGNYVKCAVTGDKIPIDQLRYWSHDLQEAYKDASASLEAFKKANA